MVLISLLLLSGCDNILVRNECPAPAFPRCETICHAAEGSSPDSLWLDLVDSVKVMLKLRERQDDEVREDFGECDCSEFGRAG